MAKITAPVKGFKGKVAGVEFKDGHGETDDKNAIAYFRRKGYGISGSKPTGTGAGKSSVEPADPREVFVQRVGTPIRDAAVDPEKRDFLVPTNAGQANPHGFDVVSPGIHANQGVRPVKGGDVHVEDTDTQDSEETKHTVASQSGMVPGSEPVEKPAKKTAKKSSGKKSGGKKKSGKKTAKKA